MKLTSVTFDNDEDPETFSVVLTRDEMALLYRLTGSIGPGFVAAAAGGEQRWADATMEIASCIGSAFNRFYENGVNDVAPRFGLVEIVAKKAEA